MPSMNNILSIAIPPAELQAIKDTIDLLDTQLEPYLISLTPKQRQAIPMLTEKTVAYLEKIQAYIKSSPEFVPVYLNVDDFCIDLESFIVLQGLFRKLAKIESGLDDTIMQAGKEAYNQSLGYYNSVKQAAAMNIVNAKGIYEDLFKRFEVVKVKKVVEKEDG